jgi:hypothetical protein
LGEPSWTSDQRAELRLFRPIESLSPQSNAHILAEMIHIPGQKPGNSTKIISSFAFEGGGGEGKFSRMAKFSATAVPDFC